MSATSNAELPAENVFGHTKKVHLLLDALTRLRQELGRGLEILDVGCGNGSAVTRFLGAPGDRVLGIDEHAESVEFARRKFGSGGLDFEVRRAEDLSAAQGRFDAVILADVLEHLDEPQRMLDLSALLLRKGGAVLVSVPNGRGPFEVESWLNRLPGVGSASLKLLDYFVAFLNRFVFPGAWTRVVQPQEELPYNVHSAHVQFFSKRRIVEMARQSGLELKSCANLSWLCGPYTNSLLAPSRAFCAWNARIAGALPASLVSAWFFEFHNPRSGGPGRRPCYLQRSCEVPMGESRMESSARIHAAKQWNRTACGELEGDRNTASYFLRVEEARYSQQRWQHEYFKFNHFAGKRVLEIGVGQGTDLVQFAKGGAICAGVDITDNHLVLTQRNFDLREMAVDLRKADALHLPFESSSFDCVYSFGVVHHIPEASEALEEAYRVLKPGGTIMAAVYHKWSAFHLFCKLLANGVRRGWLFTKGYAGLLATIETGADGVDIKPYVKLYSRREVRKLFTKFVIQDLSVHQLQADHFWPAPVARGVRRFVPRLEGRLGWYVTCKATKPLTRVSASG